MEKIEAQMDKIEAQMEKIEAPLFTFGVIADIQYADLKDGYNYRRTRKRYYRNSLQLLRNAIRSWNEEDVKPSFILQLGDIIDGFNSKNGASDKALKTVMDEFRSCSAQVHHVWGNHEFYNFSRSDLFSSDLNSEVKVDEEIDDRMDLVYAYHFSPAPNFRFVVLDAYDLSIIGREESCEKYSQSLDIIKSHNPNEELNQPAGIYPLDERFVKFNGGFSQGQVDWLDRVLTSADEKGEKVTVVSHVPVHPLSTSSICLAWNFDDVLSLLQSHKSVVCFMAGHDHDGGYCIDTAGIHHLTLEGVIETPPGGDAFCTVCVYEDKMILRGKGRIKNRKLWYR
ncbi:manganese-dependent ADP-ribose/CDP-alcohol diphosphatase isoform X1 [Tachysurus fulvidraco]|uniref:manganese-dependent ADP-ribose/CDP-alcohol diphosphatase isoform X1 n=1 Tax=Tachysurus fulvidraco TaxID=1234273 RepID=UPI000F4DE1D7|nr:manganese-dependent ADP-ribose/CDP-alcohol diphosphatase isoform X1 [Tachysurus fulvidraco]